VGAGGGTGSPSPSASPSPDSSSSSPSPSASSPTSTVYDYDNESPSCGDCTHVGDVPSGTARFVVTKTTLGQPNCYRLLATADKTQSLFTPQMCVVMPTAAEVEDAKSAASGSSGSGSGGSSEAAASVPCPPFEPMADKLSDTALALTWMLPSETPEGQETVACDKNTKISGFDIQRQVLSGWSGVSPGPAASDTALEVKDLEPATKYCFRMRSKAGDQNSAYSATFCKKTKKASASPSPTLTPVPADPNFVASPTPSPSADAGSAAKADPNTASPAPSASATPSESETASGDATAGALMDSSPAPSPTESSIWSEPKTVPIPL
jgi:hypothetical protein